MWQAMDKLLLDHGADVAGASHDVFHCADVADTDHAGFTALMAAAAGGHEAVAKRVLDHVADMAAAGHHGEAALTLASQGGPEAVAILMAGPRCGCGRRKPR